MKKLGIRGTLLLLVAFAFAVPAFASTSTEASGYAEVTAWSQDPSGNLVASVNWTGTFEGTLTHTFSEGRADAATFKGCVAGRCGTLDMLIVRTWGDPAIPGYHGRWVIRSGSEGLETLRGQGTFVLESFAPVAGPYGGQIHFDPN
jgi:hypothetical protein